jgi:hypothetical protein
MPGFDFSGILNQVKELQERKETFRMRRGRVGLRQSVLSAAVARIWQAAEARNGGDAVSSSKFRINPKLETH